MQSVFSYSKHQQVNLEFSQQDHFNYLSSGSQTKYVGRTQKAGTNTDWGIYDESVCSMFVHQGPSFMKDYVCQTLNLDWKVY